MDDKIANETQSNEKREWDEMDPNNVTGGLNAIKIIK
jgi:hypothetical protein